jgi:hypothetical protein
MPGKTTISSVILLVLCACALRAQQDARQVAIVSDLNAPGVDATMASAFSEYLRGRLTSDCTGYRFVQPDGCSGDGCAAGKTVSGSITKNSAGYEISVRVTDAATGKAAANATEKCDGCSDGAFFRAIALAAGDIAPAFGGEKARQQPRIAASAKAAVLAAAATVPAMTALPTSSPAVPAATQTSKPAATKPVATPKSSAIAANTAPAKISSGISLPGAAAVTALVAAAPAMAAANAAPAAVAATATATTATATPASVAATAVKPSATSAAAPSATAAQAQATASPAIPQPAITAAQTASAPAAASASAAQPTSQSATAAQSAQKTAAAAPISAAQPAAAPTATPAPAKTDSKNNRQTAAPAKTPAAEKAQSGDRPLKWEVALGGGEARPLTGDWAKEVGGATDLYAAIGRRLPPNSSAGIEAASDAKFNSSGNGENKTMPASAYFQIYHVGPYIKSGMPMPVFGNRVKLYGVASIAMYGWNTNDIYNNSGRLVMPKMSGSRIGINAGEGLEWSVTRHIGIDVELRWEHIFNMVTNAQTGSDLGFSASNYVPRAMLWYAF